MGMKLLAAMSTQQ